MPEYAYDLTLTAAIRVTADNEAAGRALLLERLDCADSNFGAWPNGDPINAEASADPKSLRLFEVDREPYVPSEDERWIICAEDNHASFELCETGKFAGCWYVRDEQEETLIIDGSNHARTKAEAARLYCEDRGCVPAG